MSRENELVLGGASSSLNTNSFFSKGANTIFAIQNKRISKVIIKTADNCKSTAQALRCTIIKLKLWFHRINPPHSCYLKLFEFAHSVTKIISPPLALRIIPTPAAKLGSESEITARK